MSLLQSEYDALCQEYRKERADKMIEVLNWYKESTGREYRSDYAAIKSWAADRVLADEQKKEKMVKPHACTLSDIGVIADQYSICR